MRSFVRSLLRFPEILAYMLQSTEYSAGSYLKWFWRTRDFSAVMNRRTLDRTSIARLIVLFLYAGILVQIAIGVLLVVVGAINDEIELYITGGIVIVLAPIVWAHLVIVPTIIARKLIIDPRRKREQQRTQEILKKHKGIIIGVAGSYGKTTMKEILATILSEGKKVAATPANKNVAVAHYQFARDLSGDEDVLVIEYGEGKPGDVELFARATRPDIGVITGIAPAHLDQYGSTEEAAKDIFALADYLHDSQVYVNKESSLAEAFIKPSHITYDRSGVGEWKVGDVSVRIEGTKFALTRGTQKIHVSSQLLGEHLVGVLSAAVVIAVDLGLTNEQIKAGLEKTKPYEHRMQPYPLAGAWVIDDAYNGNLEGVRAGTQLLSELSATRKLYVTPGLVDQGSETQSVHLEVGRLIAAARPDIVVLMKNSVTEYIISGLQESKFDGEVRIEEQPLRFYTHLDQILAAGDIVMLQNDWTDNYN